MRHLAVIVAALSALSPAVAQDVASEHDQWAVYTLITSQYVDKYCPDLRVNQKLLKFFMKRYGVTVHDANSRLKPLKITGEKILYRSLGRSKQALCKHFAEFYGENGRFPGIIEPREAQEAE